jgi:glycine/D-amino acid oxidase-like deaminating enzyme
MPLRVRERSGVVTNDVVVVANGSVAGLLARVGVVIGVPIDVAAVRAGVVMVGLFGVT